MKLIALCSCPRLGFIDFMGQSLVSFQRNNVAIHTVFGAYWAEALSEAIKNAANSGFDYIFTCDYDSLFGPAQVAELLRLMQEHPEADAITSVQAGRFSGPLFSTATGEASAQELAQELLPITTGHFGLTILRAASLERLKKPWFHKAPSSAGDWAPGSDKVDDDIYFWRNLTASGLKAFLAPRVVIGHLELLVKWPDERLGATYQELSHYREHGMPPDVWK